MIYLITERASKAQLNSMLEALGNYVKLAVDIRLEILAGGGVMHADCEAVLLENGSKQADIWGADWNPSIQEVTFESLINIRSRQNNPSMEILDTTIRQQVTAVTHKLLGDI